MNIQLGDKARDSITGYTGIVIARTEWLNGCWRITIQAQELKDGKPVDNQTFDAEQVEVVDAKHKPEPARRTGGPFPDPVPQGRTT